MTAKACTHINTEAGVRQLRIDRVLQMQVQIALALASCQQCGAGYLLKLLDMTAAYAAYQVSSVDSSVYTGTLRSLDKGSCDVSRAQQEVFNLANGAHLLPRILLSQQAQFSHWLDWTQTSAAAAGKAGKAGKAAKKERGPLYDGQLISQLLRQLGTSARP